MFKYRLVKTIAMSYFLTALAFSFTHFIGAGQKVGLTGIGAASMPVLVDGLALVGMVLRSKYFDDYTNKIGLRMQLVCGTLSLAVNIYAGHTIGERIQGAAWVTAYLYLESVVSKIKTRAATLAARNADNEADALRQAQAALDAANAWMSACNHPTSCGSADQCSKKSAATAKAAKTRTAKARKLAQQNKVLAEITA